MKLLNTVFIFYFLSISVLFAQNTWEKTSSEDIRYQKFAVLEDGTILCGSDGQGLYKSTDNGYTWARLENFTLAATINDIEINHTNGDIFVASDDGLDQSTDNGETWIRTFDDGWVQFCCISADGTIFTGLSDSGIFFSADDGATWKKQTNNPGFSLAYLMFLTNEGTLILNSHTYAHDGIYFSTDGGVSWTEAICSEDNPSAMGFAMDSKGNVYFSSLSTVYKSTDEGKHWSVLPDVFDETFLLYDITIGPNDEIFVVTAPYESPVETTGVFYTTDEGSNWQKYGTVDGADVIAPLSIILNSENKLIAATKDGIWMTSQSVGQNSVAEMENESYTISNYNKCNGLFKLTFDNQSTAKHQVNVFDSFGRILISEKDIQEDMEIDLRRYARGFYYLVVDNQYFSKLLY